MAAPQAKMPRWITPRSEASAGRKPPAKAGRLRQPHALHAGQFSAAESRCFLRIVSESVQIRRHSDIYRWLQGEVQHLLPHDILLSAWGDFGAWDVKLDLISALPGVRTARLARCQGLDPLVRQAYTRWIHAGREPVHLNLAEADVGQRDCRCRIHLALRGMQTLLVHGIHDKRSGRDSLFLALSRAGHGRRGAANESFVLEPLVAQIDSAFRRVAPFPLADARRAITGGAPVLGLSKRELQVLDALYRGKTNLGIATTLGISLFTVKNHLKRIFPKISVTNRAQAAARYAEAVQQAAHKLAKASNA